MQVSAKTGAWLLVVLALALPGAWLWLQPQPRDDFDYAGAFESAPQDAQRVVLDVRELAAQGPDAVARTLGAPLACETSLYSLRCRYATAQAEIAYIDGAADWITIRALGEADLAPASLRLLGLPPAEPDESGASQLVWRNLAGLNEVMLVGEDGRLRYARIKAVHP